VLSESYALRTDVVFVGDALFTGLYAGEGFAAAFCKFSRRISANVAFASSVFDPAAFAGAPAKQCLQSAHAVQFSNGNAGSSEKQSVSSVITPAATNSNAFDTGSSSLAPSPPA
jgi:hypothetical protein